MFIRFGIAATAIVGLRALLPGRWALCSVCARALIVDPGVELHGPEVDCEAGARLVAVYTGFCVF